MSSRIVRTISEAPTPHGAADHDEEEVKLLIAQAMELSQNENVRTALFKILQTEYSDFADLLESQVDLLICQVNSLIWPPSIFYRLIDQ